MPYDSVVPFDHELEEIGQPQTTKPVQEEECKKSSYKRVLIQLEMIVLYVVVVTVQDSCRGVFGSRQKMMSCLRS